MANIGKDDKSMFYQIAHECLNNGIATIRFDFDGHGDSDGEFCDMNVLSEILDAAKIIDYVRGLDFVTEINILGHSQGALVGGMMAGYYRECINKLIMLAPAAAIKDDSLIGSCFGTPYDMINVPDKFPVKIMRVIIMKSAVCISELQEHCRFMKLHQCSVVKH